MGALESLADDGGRVSWALVGVLGLAILANVVEGDLVWGGFLALTFAVLVLPAVVLRDASAMLPPWVTALAVLPGVSRAVGPAWATEYATHVGVAAVALAVVVEIALFTETEMAPWFADVLVVMTTMAAIGVWTVLQFASDRFLGTDLIEGLNAVNWEFVRATVAGIVAAGLFEFYFEHGADSDATVSEVAGGESG